MTPAERGAIEASVQRVQTDFRDWASSHIERSEPKDDVVAQYTLPNYPGTRMSISNFVAGVFATIGSDCAAPRIARSPQDAAAEVWVWRQD